MTPLAHITDVQVDSYYNPTTPPERPGKVIATIKVQLVWDPHTDPDIATFLTQAKGKPLPVKIDTEIIADLLLQKKSSDWIHRRGMWEWNNPKPPSTSDQLLTLVEHFTPPCEGPTCQPKHK
ncbi:MAG: hypothetical protein V3S55_09710 [Nitrospiraceae bacterium]